MAFLGRIDHQVKVRGFRVELGEVETALARHPGVREGVVVAREGQPGGKRLTGYVVCHQEPGPAVGELRDFLKDRLPEYMVPSVFVELEELPLTPSGKVDRRALPTPTDERPDLGTAYVTPRNKMERSIASIWEDVLGVERVGINDNFFDLGGHSLLMAQVHGRLQQVWQADLSMVDLFRYPTISALVEHLSRERGAGVSFEEEGDRVSRQKEALKRQRQRMSALARKPR
jgi:acyl carrier protein